MAEVVLFDCTVYTLTVCILPGVMRHTMSQPPTIQIPLVLTAGVLNPAIGMNDQLAQPLSFPGSNSFIQTTNLACRTQVPAAMAGQNLTGKHINHKANVIPPATAPNIGNIGLPHLIGPGYPQSFYEV